MDEERPGAPPKAAPSPIVTATIRDVRWLPARAPSSAADAPEEKINTQPAPRRMR